MKEISCRGKLLDTVIVGVTSFASALGIPLAADLWKNAQVKREEKL